MEAIMRELFIQGTPGGMRAWAFLFIRGEKTYFWNAVLGIREAGNFFSCEIEASK